MTERGIHSNRNELSIYKLRLLSSLLGADLSGRIVEKLFQDCPRSLSLSLSLNARQGTRWKLPLNVPNTWDLFLTASSAFRDERSRRANPTFGARFEINMGNKNGCCTDGARTLQLPRMLAVNERGEKKVIDGCVTIYKFLEQSAKPSVYAPIRLPGSNAALSIIFPRLLARAPGRTMLQ